MVNECEVRSNTKQGGIYILLWRLRPALKITETSTYTRTSSGKCVLKVVLTSQLRMRL